MINAKFDELPMDETQTHILNELRYIRYLLTVGVVCLGIGLLVFLSTHLMNYLSSRKWERNFGVQASYLNNNYQWEKLRKISEERISAYPNEPEGYWYVGNAYLNLGEYEKAVEAYQKAMEMRPDWENVLSPLLKEAREKLNHEEE